MERFVIILKNDKLSSYRRIGIIILLLHFFFFTYSFLKVDHHFAVIAGIVVSTVVLIFQFVSIKNSKAPLIPVSAGFILLAIVWILFNNYWLAPALLILAFLDFVSSRKPALHFFEDRIEMNTFPKKILYWKELNQVMLKDAILTLDCKNNHFIQGEIAAESLDVSEATFNQFCYLQCHREQPGEI